MAAASQRRPVRAAPVGAALRRARFAFWIVGGVTFCINLLMLASPIFSMQLFNRVLTTGHLETLVGLVVVLVIALSALGALEGLRTVLLSRLAHWVERSLGPLALSASVSAALRGGVPNAAMLADLRQIKQFLSSSLLGTLFDAPWMPLFLLILAILHPWFLWLGLASAALLMVVALMNERVERQASAASARLAEDAQRQADAAIRNADAVVAMGMLDRLTARWCSLIERAAESGDGGSNATAALGGLSKGLRIFLQSVVMALGADLAIRGEIPSGSLIAASILMGRALAPIDQAIGGWRTFVRARAAYVRLNETLADHLEVAAPRIILPPPEGRLSIEGLAVRPPGGAGYLLQNITFELRPGETLGVVGASGSGKTTLCRALVGSLRPALGQIRLDGAEQSQWDPGQWGGAVGYLPQDVELFAGSIAENVARFTDCPDEAIVAAAQKAQCHDLILRLPDGYQTQLIEGGRSLSGGQRQRIGLARALFGSPCLLVLDEPNANLDELGENALWHALRRLKMLRTTIVMVSHRRSALDICDKLLVLEEGRVADFGPRAEVLLRQPGLMPRQRAQEQAI